GRLAQSNLAALDYCCAIGECEVQSGDRSVRLLDPARNWSRVFAASLAEPPEQKLPLGVRQQSLADSGRLVYEISPQFLEIGRFLHRRSARLCTAIVLELIARGHPAEFDHLCAEAIDLKKRCADAPL